MMFKTELRTFYKLGETPLDKYIDSIVAIDINNLTIKEEDDMLEKLLERIEAMKVKKEVYVAELENLKATNLDEIINNRFELVKETIAKEVEDEFNVKLAEAELKVAHFDFVIAEDEKELDQLRTEAEQPVENTEV